MFSSNRKTQELKIKLDLIFIFFCRIARTLRNSTSYKNHFVDSRYRNLWFVATKKGGHTLPPKFQPWSIWIHLRYSNLSLYIRCWVDEDRIRKVCGVRGFSMMKTLTHIFGIGDTTYKSSVAWCFIESHVRIVSIYVKSGWGPLRIMWQGSRNIR